MLAFEAVAATGSGVLETLNAAARLLLAKYSKTPNANVTGMSEPNPLRGGAAAATMPGVSAEGGATRRRQT